MCVCVCVWWWGDGGGTVCAHMSVGECVYVSVCGVGSVCIYCACEYKHVGRDS